MKRAHDCHACSCDCDGCAGSDPKRARLAKADRIDFDRMVDLLGDVDDWQERAKTWTDLSGKEGPLLSEDLAGHFVADYRGTCWWGAKHHPDFVPMLGVLDKAYMLVDKDSPAAQAYLKHVNRAHPHEHFVVTSPLDLVLRANLFYNDDPSALETVYTIAREMGKPHEMIGLVCWAICARQHPDDNQRQMELTRVAMTHLCNLLLHFYGPLVGVSVVEYSSFSYEFVLKKEGQEKQLTVNMPRLFEIWFDGFRMPNYVFAERPNPTDEQVRAFFAPQPAVVTA